MTPEPRSAETERWVERFDLLAEELERTEAERDRYRAALEKIAHPSAGANFQAIARAALDPTDTYPEAGETTLDTIDRHLSKRGTTP